MDRSRPRRQAPAGPPGSASCRASRPRSPKAPIRRRTTGSQAAAPSAWARITMSTRSRPGTDRTRPGTAQAKPSPNGVPKPEVRVTVGRSTEPSPPVPVPGIRNAAPAGGSDGDGPDTPPTGTPFGPGSPDRAGSAVEPGWPGVSAADAGVADAAVSDGRGVAA